MDAFVTNPIDGRLSACLAAQRDRLAGGRASLGRAARGGARRPCGRRSSPCGRLRRGRPDRFRPPLRSRDEARRSLSGGGGPAACAAAFQALDEAAPPPDSVDVQPGRRDAWSTSRSESSASSALELSGAARPFAADGGDRGGQPGHDQALGDHARDLRAARASIGEVFEPDEVAVVQGGADVATGFRAA